MRTLGLILVLSAGVLVMALALIPLQISVQVHAYPQADVTTLGKARVGQIDVYNNGVVSRNVQLPELVGCQGDTEVPLDAWPVEDGTIVRGAGQIPYIQVGAGQQGTVYIVATDVDIHETVRLYQRTPYFSCLTPGKAL
jgi:hypothetical protein